MTQDLLARVVESGVSPWLDDLSRSRLTSGNLADLIRTHHVLGVTTNPTIFEKAIAGSDAYAEQVRALAAEGADADAAVRAMTTDDVRDAADLFAEQVPDPVQGDARVSIEVDPRLAYDAAGTLAQAKELWQLVDRRNIYIKIPATPEGLTAISDVIAEGISVNATLIFSPDHFRAVANAYVVGLERAHAAGRDLAQIASVSSLFLSRIDASVDAALAETGSENTPALQGRAAIATARVCYEVFGEVFGSPRWEELAAVGAQVQRPLWASTGTKNPEYPDTMYVDRLLAPQIVNTMPEKTLLATGDHARLPLGAGPINTITSAIGDAHAVLEEIEAAGVELAPIAEKLQRDGAASFVTSWENLLDTVTASLTEAQAGTA